MYPKGHYVAATIFFPEWFKENDVPREVLGPLGKFRQNSINLELDEYRVEVKTGFILPHGFRIDENGVEQLITIPTIEAVTIEIKLIYDLLPELRELANNGKIQKNIFYEKGFDGDVSFFDYSKSGIFDKLGKLEHLPYELIRPEFHELIELAQHVNCGEKRTGTVASVAGDDLREATKRALKIYKRSEEIGSLTYHMP